MNTKMLNTFHLSANEQLAFWNEAICNTFTKLHCDRQQGTDLTQRGFIASLENWQLDNFSLAEVRSPPSVVKHSVTHANQILDDRLLIHLQTKGTSTHTQNNITVPLKPGEFAIAFESQPYQLDFNCYHEMLVVNIPMKKFTAHANVTLVNESIRVAQNEPICRMITMATFTLWQCRQQYFDSRVMATIENNIVNLIATLIEVAGPQPVKSETSLKRYHLGRIESVLQAQFNDSDLNVSQVAATVGISERYLRSLLNSVETTFTKAIMEVRLAKASQMLRSP
ncbi:MAG: hypothetical protein CMI12_10135, partial [Oceanospirillum sp.]|nr:hypothetical protein [Oceanospirillum sp.]